jgi:hypothetical protein
MLLMPFLFYAFVIVVIALELLIITFETVRVLIGVTAVYFSLPLFGFTAMPWTALFVASEAVAFAFYLVRSGLWRGE